MIAAAANTNYRPLTSEDYRQLVLDAIDLLGSFRIDRFWSANLYAAAYDPDIAKTPQAVAKAAHDAMASLNALDRPLPPPRRRR